MTIHVLQEAETITDEQLQELCEELQELGRTRCHGNSNSVDTAEWKAARIIRALIIQYKHCETPKREVVS